VAAKCVQNLVTEKISVPSYFSRDFKNFEEADFRYLKFKFFGQRIVQVGSMVKLPSYSGSVIPSRIQDRNKSLRIRNNAKHHYRLLTGGGGGGLCTI
jgi:hypothetical protein